MRRENHQTLPTARNNHKIPYFKRMYQFIYVYCISVSVLWKRLSTFTNKRILINWHSRWWIHEDLSKRWKIHKYKHAHKRPHENYLYIEKNMIRFKRVNGENFIINICTRIDVTMIVNHNVDFEYRMYGSS